MVAQRLGITLEDLESVDPYGQVFPARLLELFRSVDYGGRVEHPYSMPYEHFDVWVCRGPRQPLATFWPELKKYR